MREVVRLSLSPEPEGAEMERWSLGRLRRNAGNRVVTRCPGASTLPRLCAIT